MDTLEELAKMTHVVEYSPSCPRRFLVRLVGEGTGIIDKKPYYPIRKTKDILGFGRTLKEAARRALVKKKSSDDRFSKRLARN